jgi:hypothetical protein
MQTQILTILLTVLFAGSYQQSKPVNSESIPTVSYCELIRNSNLYVGKMVRVRATWEYGFEWTFLYDRECLNKNNRAWVEFENEDELCSASKKNLKKLKDKGFTNKADVIMVGKLSGPEGGRKYGDGGYSFQFVVTCLEYANSVQFNVP